MRVRIQALQQRFLTIPQPIRLLTLGVFVNRLGGFFTTFLALILVIRGFDGWQVSLGLALVGIFGIVGASMGTVMASLVGNRWTIVLSTGGMALLTLLLILPLSYPAIIVVACGISACNRAYMPASAAIVGKLTPASDRVPMFAFYRLTFNIGAAVAPLMGAFLLTRSMTTLLLIDAITSGSFALVALRLPLDRPLPQKDVDIQFSQRKNTVLRDLPYLVLCVALGFVAAVYGQQAGVLPLIMKDYHYNLELLGTLLSANAIVVLLCELPLSTITRYWRSWIPLAIGAALICAGYAIYLIGVSVATIVAGFALWTFGEMLLTPIAPAVAAARASPKTQSSYQGMLSIAQTAGQTIGPAIGVFAYSLNTSLPWWGCGIGGIVSVAVIIWTLQLVHRV